MWRARGNAPQGVDDHDGLDHDYFAHSQATIARALPRRWWGTREAGRQRSD